MDAPFIARSTEIIASGCGPGATIPIPPPFSAISITSATASKSVTRTQGAGTSRRVMTFSAWLKLSNAGAMLDHPFVASPAGENVRFGFAVQFNHVGGAVQTTGFTAASNIWYHYLTQCDTTQAVDTDRVKLIINGVNYTDTAGSIYPTLNQDFAWGSSGDTEEAAKVSSGAGTVLFDELARFDGQIYGYSDVTNSGRPKDISALTFGAQGYWLRFETGVASTAGTDSSGNSNTFTNSGFVDGDFSADVP